MRNKKVAAIIMVSLYMTAVNPQFAGRAIHAAAKKQGADSGKIKVAVVDSGINYSDDI